MGLLTFSAVFLILATVRVLGSAQSARSKKTITECSLIKEVQPFSLWSALLFSSFISLGNVSLAEAEISRRLGFSVVLCGLAYSVTQYSVLVW